MFYIICSLWADETEKRAASTFEKVRAIDNVWWYALYRETVWVSEWVCCVLCDIIWLLKTQCTIYISCAHFFSFTFRGPYFPLSVLWVFFHLHICYSNHLIPAIGTVTEESKWLKINWIKTIHIKYASRFELCVVTRHINLCFWREYLRSGLWFSNWMPSLVSLVLLLIDQM